MRAYNRLPTDGGPLQWGAQHLRLDGPLPGANAILGSKRVATGAGGGDKYARDKRQFTDYVWAAIKSQGVRPVWCASFVFGWSLMGRKGPAPDPDNLTLVRKWILDGLVTAAVLHDDQAADVWPVYERGKEPYPRAAVEPPFVHGGWADVCAEHHYWCDGGNAVEIQLFGPFVEINTPVGKAEMDDRRARLDQAALRAAGAKQRATTRRRGTSSFDRPRGGGKGW